MRVRYGILGVAAVAALALSSCGRSDKVPQLMHIKSQTRSPDEFTILPTKPLTMPDDLAKLPDPTPGGSNITDPTPSVNVYYKAYAPMSLDQYQELERWRSAGVRNVGAPPEGTGSK